MGDKGVARRWLPAIVAAAVLGLAGTLADAGLAKQRPGPRITPPATVTAEATGPGGAVVAYRVKVSGAASVAYSKRSGTRFPLGTTVVRITARDRAGTAARATFKVRVVDTTPPRLAAPADPTAEAVQSSGASVSFTLAAATDLVSGAITPVCSLASGAIFPIGSTTVTCTATDRAGNRASVSFAVKVADTKPPVFAAKADVDASATGTSGAAVSYAAPAAADPTGAPTVTCTPASGSTFPVGTTTVTCTARDVGGNTATTTFHVVVAAMASVPGSYSGTTSRGDSVSFAVSSSGLGMSSILVGVSADCGGGTFTATLSLASVSIGSNGTFSDSGTVPVSGSVTGTGTYSFTGSFSTANSSASGSFSNNISLTSPVDSCSTGSESWSATRTGP